ncbi:Oidioi.mRNA.OKI2018_I69.XSR.g16602.t1.cds [Oikopleura dioica]|uniref:Oidioi.mRNA.OKI2018_I69.XSR.g16602.t1.cds n=1 Tax=Oikopleura dioica TaxID=34765 RepID=A0ABN7SKM4_OIKDI|nr:Oidioi.mRNA.OKI2018_I69.XSR.g16602.t1.cds [Oikopleura dioica]
MSMRRISVGQVTGSANSRTAQHNTSRFNELFYLKLQECHENRSNCHASDPSQTTEDRSAVTVHELAAIHEPSNNTF